MSTDLFSAGFAWTDDNVSQADATPVATPENDPFASEDGNRRALPPSAVASVAPVAETDGQRLVRQLSQPPVASPATPDATARSADLRGIEPALAAPVADVATVAGWHAGIESLNGRRVPAGIDRGSWAGLVRDAQRLMSLWGHDLHALGWSACDVFGVERDMAHRRLDRLGLVTFVDEAEVEAIDRDSATLLHGKDWLTFDRRLRASGSVPLWAVRVEEEL